MINPQWLELPMSRINFHGLNDIRAIESLLYKWMNPEKATITKTTFRITKTCLYNFDPLKPHFYIVKLELTGVYIIFLISAQKHRLWYSLEPPRRGGSNEYLQAMFWAEIWFFFIFFLSENFHFLVVKISVYLNRHVIVMGHQKKKRWRTHNDKRTTTYETIIAQTKKNCRKSFKAFRKHAYSNV